MRKAFSLVELLVVAAIVAILASVLLPVFAGARTSARAAGEFSNLKQIGLAHLAYCADHNDAFALATRVDPAAHRAAYGDAEAYRVSPNNAVPWQESVSPYVKSRDAYASPLEKAVSETGVARRFLDSKYFGVVPRATAIGAVLAPGNPAYAFSMAGWYGRGARVDGPFGIGLNDGRSCPSRTQTSIDRAGDKIMVADAGSWDMGFLSGGAFATADATCYHTEYYNIYVDEVRKTMWEDYSEGYVGPWAREGVKGAWGGGKLCRYEMGQKGTTNYVAIDGSVKRMALDRAYEIRRSGPTPVVYRMWAGSTD